MILFGPYKRGVGALGKTFKSINDFPTFFCLSNATLPNVATGPTRHEASKRRRAGINYALTFESLV